MNLYESKQLTDSMRVVRKNTIAIAEDIPEAQYDYRPTPDSRSVRETLLHIHEEQRHDSMEGFDFRGFFAGLPTYEKLALSKKEILDALGDEGERWCGWVEKLPGGAGGRRKSSGRTSFLDASRPRRSCGK